MRFSIAALFLLLCLSFVACDNKDTQKMPNCVNKKTCLNDPNCYCWCSQICNWRKKTSDDNPVYLENEPHGKFCYCKQWDYDNYENNCIYGKNIPEPADAK